jgi:hypothetical protein
MFRMKIKERPDTICLLCPVAVPQSCDSGAFDHQRLIRNSLIDPDQLSEGEFKSVCGAVSDDADDSPEPFVRIGDGEPTVSKSIVWAI